jgi:hypothetical protein
MKILCFGSFAEILRVCCRGYVPGSKRTRNEIVPQTKLVGELLNSVDTAFGKDWTSGDNSQQLTRKLLRCEQHIPDELKPAAAEVTPTDIAEYLQENVLPLLEKPEAVVLALLDVIEKDEGMTDSVIATYFGAESKQRLLENHSINLLDFLSNAFVYTLRGIDNKKGKAAITEVNETYILSFAAKTNQIQLDTTSLVATSNAVTSLKAQRSLFDMEVSNEFTPPLHEWQLVLEVGGECPECGKSLSEEKNGKSLPRYKVAVIDQSKPSLTSVNRIAMCPECCDRYIFDTSEEDIARLSKLKSDFASSFRSKDAMAENKVPIEIQIEEVLNAIEMTPEASLTRICDERAFEVERKVTESVILMRKIRDDALEYFECVESLLKASDRARSQKFRLFQSKVISCYEEAKANATSQEKIYNHLVDWLFRQAKHQHKTACEIIIAFFVQLCDVFEPEAAEEDEYATAE